MARSLDRPDTPNAPDRQDPGDALRQLRSPADQPAPWSQVDLQQRLERLPPGHPSSLSRTDQSRNHLPGPQDPGRRSPDEGPEQDHDAAADGPPRDPDAIKGPYWREVPRLLRAWADHMLRWPAEKAPAVDRSRDPEGSWRGGGNQYLDPEQHAHATDAIAKVQLSEKKLTEDLKGIEQENARGGRLDGLEFCRKSEERLKEKIAEKIEHQPGRSPGEAAREINDAIRYTFCFELSSYVTGYWEVKLGLEAKTCRMIYSENHWRDDPEYKGINTRWITPEGQRFELQFHTAESFHAKQVTHRAYERSRNPLTVRTERLELEALQQDVCSFIRAPAAVDRIPDYKEEER